MFKILLSIILALSIGVSTVHHHKDGRIHLDCPVCVFQINNHSDNSDISINLPVIENPPVIPDKKENKNSYKKIRHYQQRAPPFSLYL
ncbi:hypothetical protein [Persephonella hydrogeniphila]|nr:hypothetical protein [Persephonella hydrogeniphila]